MTDHSRESSSPAAAGASLVSTAHKIMQRCIEPGHDPSEAIDNWTLIEQMCVQDSSQEGHDRKVVNVNRYFKYQDNESGTIHQWTLLHLAVILCNVSLVKTLLSSCDKETVLPDRNGQDIVWKERSVNVNAPDANRRTPLHCAILMLRDSHKIAVEICEALLQCPGVDLEAKDDSGHTPLHYVCAYDISDIDTLITMLCNAGCNLNVVSDKTGDNGLHIACRTSNYLAAKALLHGGVSMKQKNSAGWTPLMVAANTTMVHKNAPLLVKSVRNTEELHQGEHVSYYNADRMELYREMMAHETYAESWNETDQNRRSTLHIALAAKNRDFVLVACESFEGLILQGSITQEQLASSILAQDFDERQTCLHLAALTLDAEVTSSILNLLPHDDQGDVKSINYTNGNRLTALQEVVNVWRESNYFDFDTHDRCMEVCRVLIAKGATLTGITVGKIIRWEAVDRFLVQERKLFELKRKGVSSLHGNGGEFSPLMERTRSRFRSVGSSMDMGDMSPSSPWSPSSSPSSSFSSPASPIHDRDVQRQQAINRRLSSRLSLRNIRKSISDLKSLIRSDSISSTGSTAHTPVSAGSPVQSGRSSFASSPIPDNQDRALEDMIKKEGRQRPGSRIQRLITIVPRQSPSSSPSSSTLSYSYSSSNETNMK